MTIHPPAANQNRKDVWENRRRESNRTLGVVLKAALKDDLGPGSPWRNQSLQQIIRGWYAREVAA